MTASGREDGGGGQQVQEVGDVRCRDSSREELQLLESWSYFSDKETAISR